MPKHPGFIRVSLTCLALTPYAWAWTTQAETVRQTLPAPNGAHALAGSAPTLAPPAPGTLTAGELARQAQQYRDRGQWQAALALYRQGRQRFPDDAHFTAREIMTLADAGETDKALETARKALERQPRNTDLNLAQAYAFQRAGQPYSALLPLDRAVTLEPGIDYVKRAWILGLQQAGVKQTNRNAAIAGQTVLSDEQTRRLQADQLAARLRVLHRSGGDIRCTANWIIGNPGTDTQRAQPVLPATNPPCHHGTGVTTNAPGSFHCGRPGSVRSFFHAHRFNRYPT